MFHGNADKLLVAVVAVALGCLRAAAAEARTVHVATYGGDGPTCGPKASPCRTIGTGIANAGVGDTVEVGPGRYGDLDRDGVFGEVDEEGTPAPCDPMISIDKRITLVSRDGSRSTIIDAGDIVPGCLSPAIGIGSPDAVVGNMNRGFTVISPDPAIGLGFTAENAVVSGNRIVGTGTGMGITLLPIIGPSHASIVGNDVWVVSSASTRTRAGRSVRTPCRGARSKESWCPAAAAAVW